MKGEMTHGQESSSIVQKADAQQRRQKKSTSNNEKSSCDQNMEPCAFEVGHQSLDRNESAGVAASRILDAVHALSEAGYEIVVRDGLTLVQRRKRPDYASENTNGSLPGFDEKSASAG
jgi:hypothetical protein